MLFRSSLAPEHGPVPLPELTEGWYLGLAVKEPQKGIQGARVVLVNVIEVLEDGGVRAEVGAAAAAQVKEGEALLLFRPVKSTTAKLKRLPDIAPLEQSNQKNAGLTNEAQLLQSRNNLQAIAMAMHSYHDKYGCFPPAVVNGPDGKPWHSWRVLILPYVRGDEIYNQYRFDEPWNGPNNSKLLTKMPQVYSDPIHGENKDFYTHYVVPTGDDTIFSAEGVKMSGKDDRDFGSHGRAIQQIGDGTSDTILVVPATPDQKIPWMKPEDLEVGISIPDLGKADSIPTPYLMGDAKGALVAFADCRVRTLKEQLSGEVLWQLLTRNEGVVINDSVLNDQDAEPSEGPPKAVIRIIKQGAETKALLELRR